MSLENQMGIVESFSKRKAQIPELTDVPPGDDDKKINEQAAAGSLDDAQKFDLLNSAIGTADELIKNQFKKLALLLEHNAGLCQKRSEKSRAGYYLEYKSTIEIMLSRFEKGLLKAADFKPVGNPIGNKPA